MALINVRDLNGDGVALGIQSYELADTIRPWFQLPPPEVSSAIDSLQVAVAAGNSDQVDAITVYLGLDLQVVA